MQAPLEIRLVGAANPNRAPVSPLTPTRPTNDSWLTAHQVGTRSATRGPARTTTPGGGRFCGALHCSPLGRRPAGAGWMLEPEMAVALQILAEDVEHAYSIEGGTIERVNTPTPRRSAELAEASSAAPVARSATTPSTLPLPGARCPFPHATRALRRSSRAPAPRACFVHACERRRGSASDARCGRPTGVNGAAVQTFAIADGSERELIVRRGARRSSEAGVSGTRAEMLARAR